ncbi:MAG: SCP-like extracellular protein [Firmicutes bacterium]|nr:SCP-like extracellular protein [Bacillota bacterium]
MEDNYDDMNNELETKESSLFQEGEVKKCKVLTDNLNVRSGAGTNFDVIGKLKANEELDVLGQVGNWYVVNMPGNKVGCVSADNTKAVVEENKKPKKTPGMVEDPTPNDENQPIDETGPTGEKGPIDQTEDNVNENTEENTGVKRLSKQEQDMVDLVNQERRKNNLSPLKVDLELARVARIKSQDMVNNNYFSHYSPTYGSPFDMMDNFGIDYLHAGENLAGNSTVKRAHDSLMGSKGHRDNILNSHFTHIGIGVVKSDKYGNIFTQMFISKPK